MILISGINRGSNAGGGGHQRQYAGGGHSGGASHNQSAGGSQHRMVQQSQKTRKPYFMPYMSLDAVNRGLASGDLVKVTVFIIILAVCKGTCENAMFCSFFSIS